MDIGRGRARQKALDIELPLALTHGAVRYVAAPGRVSRLLRLARERNTANRLPDALCRCGAWLFAVSAPLSLLVWGLVFRNVTLVLHSWAVLSAGIALPVLLAAYIRQAFGMASALHKFHSPSLTLAPDRVIVETRRHMLFRGKHPPTVRREFFFSRAAGLEYDRATKTLKLISAYTPGDSTAVEVTMFYDESGEIVREIERRAGIYIRPAMRGDDYADLRDLPGLKKERGLLRPMSIAALAFTLAAMLTALGIRGYNAKHPYMPYPKTEEAFLVGRYGVGDTIVLDGCGFTLNGAERAGSGDSGVCYQVLVTVSNHNASAIRIRMDEQYKDSPSNIAFIGITGDGGRVPLETSGAPRGYVGIDPRLPSRLAGGKSATACFFVWLPDGVKQFEMTVNSDYWPPSDILRDAPYTGGTVEIGGRAVKSNEARFTVNRPAD